MGEIARAQPPAAAPVAISQRPTRCFHGRQESTGTSLIATTITSIAETNPAHVRIAVVINSGVPKIIAATKPITAAGMSALFTLTPMFLSPEVNRGPTIGSTNDRSFMHLMRFVVHHSHQELVIRLPARWSTLENNTPRAATVSRR